MTVWERAAIIALAAERKFCWIETKQPADLGDVYYID